MNEYKICLQKTKTKLSFEAEWLIVAGWRVFGGLGLLCGGKKFLGRADFEPFWPIWKKNLGKLLELKFFFAVLSWHGKNYHIKIQ